MSAMLLDRGLAGKVALIAGGGGIGEAAARRLAAEGCCVMLGDIVADAAAAAAAAIRADGGDCSAFAYDQSDDASVRALVNATIEAYGTLDFLFVNASDMAALRIDTDVLDIDMAVFDRTMAVNMRGAVMCTRLALPHIVHNRGAIVYTSSDAAHVGENQRFSYAMAKSAINALARHVASRWGREGVRANAILPGLVMTPRIRARMDEEMQANILAGSKSHRLGESADIAAMVAMLFSRDGEWINGQTISVNGGGTMRP